LCRAHSKVLVELRGRVNGAFDGAQMEQGIKAHFDALERDFRSDALVGIEAGLRELITLCGTIDSPERPAASLRYSKVEPEVRARSARLEAQGRQWAIALKASEQALVRDTALARLRDSGEQALNQYVFEPLAEASDAIEPAVERVRQQLQAAQRSLRSSVPDPALLGRLRTELAAAIAERERHAAARADIFRVAAAMHGMSGELRSLVDTVPEQLELLAGAVPAHQLSETSMVAVKTVYLHAEARRELIQDFLPLLDLEARRGAATLQELETRVGDVLEMALSAARAAIEDEDIGPNAVDDALELALTNLAQIGEQRASS
jgi:hypothetical protein